MLFNSFPFLFAFLPLVAVGYFVIPQHRLRLLLIIGASYYFYAYAEWWFPALMAGSTAISYTGGRLLESERFAARRKLVLGLGIFGVLALLGYFKYASFTGGYALDFVHVITQRNFPDLRGFVNGIALPIGISFYTFEGISYLVDVYRGTLRAERDLLRYAFFISFFPHLIAGPIVRYGILQPQLLAKHRFDPDRVRAGLLLFTIGLAKKVLLADGLAQWVDHYLATPGSIGFVNAWACAVGFAFQIYFDFSAYSDMALGLARIFGIELPWNFDRPYRSASPTEFWRRWHVTLSTWLRDYLYIPLGGNRKERRRDVNLLATMGLGGLWHGASLNFVGWGLYHGLLRGHASWAEARLAITSRRRGRPTTFSSSSWAGFSSACGRWRGSATYTAGCSARTASVASPATLIAYLLVSAAVVWGLPEEWRWPVVSWGTLRVAATAVLFVVAAASTYTEPSLHLLPLLMRRLVFLPRSHGVSPRRNAAIRLVGRSVWSDLQARCVERRNRRELPGVRGARRVAVLVVQARHLPPPPGPDVCRRLEPSAQDPLTSRENKASQTSAFPNGTGDPPSAVHGAACQADANRVPRRRGVLVQHPPHRPAVPPDDVPDRSISLESSDDPARDQLRPPGPLRAVPPLEARAGWQPLRDRASVACDRVEGGRFARVELGARSDPVSEACRAAFHGPQPRHDS